MRRGGFSIAVVLAALFLALTALAQTAAAAVVGNWDKSARSWNNSHMTKVKAAMESAGYQVLADQPITEAGLKSLTVFVIGEPSASPSAEQLSLLKKFMSAGGMILLFGDTGIDLPTYNNLLTGVGSTMAYTSTTIGTSSALPENKFTGGPINIVGSTLSVTSGNGTAGGTLIDSNYVRYEQIGSGYMVVFGDRIDHNDVISAANTNLILNIVSIALGPIVQIPALSPAGLLLASLLLLLAASAALHHRRAARTG